MRFNEFTIITEVTASELEGMKLVIAAKIKELPADDATAKALKEIEELLQHVNAGGRMGMIYDQLEQINDPAVLASQKMLARYILSLDATPEDRKEFFSLWRADKIVNISKLLSKKTVSFDEIFNKYSSNKMIKEFVDDVMDIEELGQGRGEFGLNVLSKSIWAPEDQKGDLKMKVGGKILQIECKTTKGGAARFSDQEVRPAEGYEQAAIDVNNFVKKNRTYPASTLFPKGFPTYGLNLGKSIEFLQNITPAEKKQFLVLIKRVVTLIFGGKEADPVDVKNIINAIAAADVNEALQSWSQASFNYYIGRKDDDGVLYTDLNKKTFVFYQEAGDLEKEGLRFHASTPYLSTVKDPGRGVYPQLEIIPTTFGAASAAKKLPKYKKSDLQSQEFYNSLIDWAKAFANRRGVKDAATIKKMASQTHLLLQARTPSTQIMADLEATFPQLRAKLPTNV